MHAGSVKLSFAFMCGRFCVAGDVTWQILPLKHGKLQQVICKIVFHLKAEKNKTFFNLIVIEQHFSFLVHTLLYHLFQSYFDLIYQVRCIHKFFFTKLINQLIGAANFSHF